MIGKGSNLPETGEVMRYVSWNRLRKDENDNVIGVLPQAFEHRPDEDALSVTWIDYFGGDRPKNIIASVHQLRSVMCVGESAAFAIGKVGKIKSVCTASGANAVRIVYSPSKANQAHSQIKRVPREDTTLREALAAEAFTELVKNSEIAVA